VASQFSLLLFLGKDNPGSSHNLKPNKRLRSSGAKTKIIIYVKIIRADKRNRYFHLQVWSKVKANQTYNLSLFDLIKKFIEFKGEKPMDFIDNILEKLKQLAGKIVESLLGPQPEPEPELIPIPVDRPYYHQR
jgi:hypothetical protein